MSIMDQLHDLTSSMRIRQNEVSNQYLSTGGNANAINASTFTHMDTTLTNIYGFFRTQETNFFKTISSELSVTNQLINELIEITSDYYKISRKESNAQLIKSSNELLVKEIDNNNKSFYNLLKQELGNSNKSLEKLIDTNKAKESARKLDIDNSTNTKNNIDKISSVLKTSLSVGFKTITGYIGSQLDRQYQYGTSVSTATGSTITNVVHQVTEKIVSLTNTISGLTAQIVNVVNPKLYQNATYQSLLNTYGTEGMTYAATLYRSVENRANELQKTYDISLEEAREFAKQEASGSITENGGLPDWYKDPSKNRRFQFEQQQRLESEDFNRSQASKKDAFLNFRGSAIDTASSQLYDINYMMPTLDAASSKLFKEVLRTNEESSKDLYNEIAKVTRNLAVDATTLQSVGESYVITLRQLVGNDTDLFDKRMKSLIKTTGMLEDSFIDATNVFSDMDDLGWTPIANMSSTQISTLALQARAAGMGVTEYQAYLRNNPGDAALTMLNANKSIIDQYNLSLSDTSQRSITFADEVLGWRTRAGLTNHFQQADFDSSEAEAAYESDQGIDLGDFLRSQTLASEEFQRIQEANRTEFEKYLDETFLTDLQEALRERDRAFLADSGLYNLALSIEDESLGVNNIGTAAQTQSSQSSKLGGLITGVVEEIFSFISNKALDGIFKSIKKKFTNDNLGTSKNVLSDLNKGLSKNTQNPIAPKTLTPGESSAASSGGMSLGGFLGGVAPGALLTGAGLYGIGDSIDSYNTANYYDQYGLANSGTIERAGASAELIGGIGTTIAGGLAISGGLAAAAGGASAGAAALAGLASVPVVGWVAAGLLAVGVAAVKINELVTDIDGMGQAIDAYTTQLAQSNSELKFASKDYYKSLKDQIKTSEDLSNSYQELQNLGIAPTNLSVNQFNDLLSISKEDLADIASGLKLTDDKLEILRNVGIDPTSEAFKSLWDPSTGALIKTEDELRNLYGASGALPLLALAATDASSALSSIIDVADEESSKLLDSASQMQFDFASLSKQYELDEKDSVYKDIISKFDQVNGGRSIDISKNTDWSVFLNELGNAIQDEGQREKYLGGVKQALSNGWLERDELLSLMGQETGWAGLKAMLTPNIGKDSRLSDMTLDPAIMNQLLSHMGVDGFQRSADIENYQYQLNELAQMLATGDSSQKIQAIEQIDKLRDKIEDEYPELVSKIDSTLGESLDYYRDLLNLPHDIEVTTQTQTRALSDDLSKIDQSIKELSDSVKESQKSYTAGFGALYDALGNISPGIATSTAQGARSAASALDKAIQNNKDASKGGNPFTSSSFRRTANYGPYDPWGTGKTTMHTGVDYAAAAGTPIPVPIGGEVIKSGWDQSGYGNWVDFKGSNGYTFKFAHMIDKTPHNSGAVLNAGGTIGYVGTTGNSTGNHVHFEVRTPNNQRIDPDIYLSGLPPLASHRSGLSNVPYDGYIAELHKDERVLTSNENSIWQHLVNEKMESPGDYQPVVEAIEVLTNIVSNIYSVLNKPTTRIVEQDPSPAMIRQSNLISSYT